MHFLLCARPCSVFYWTLILQCLLDHHYTMPTGKELSSNTLLAMTTISQKYSMNLLISVGRGVEAQQYISRGGRSRLTFTDQVSLKSRVAQYCRLRNARLVQYSPLTVFGLFHYYRPGSITLKMDSYDGVGVFCCV